MRTIQVSEGTSLFHLYGIGIPMTIGPERFNLMFEVIRQFYGPDVGREISNFARTKGSITSDELQRMLQAKGVPRDHASLIVEAVLRPSSRPYGPDVPSPMSRNLGPYANPRLSRVQTMQDIAGFK